MLLNEHIARERDPKLDATLLAAKAAHQYAVCAAQHITHIAVVKPKLKLAMFFYPRYVALSISGSTATRLVRR